MNQWEMWSRPRRPRDEEERRRLARADTRALVVIAAVMGLYLVVAHIWLALAVTVVGFIAVAVIIGFVMICYQAAKGKLDP